MPRTELGESLTLQILAEPSVHALIESLAVDKHESTNEAIRDIVEIAVRLFAEDKPAEEIYTMSIALAQSLLEAKVNKSR